MTLRKHNLYDRIVENARIYKDKIAFSFESHQWTYAEYLQLVNRLSHGLLAAGIKKGERIAILLDNHLEYMLLYGACAQTGIIALGINTRTSAEEMKLLLESVVPKMLIFQQKYEETALQLQDNLALEHLVSIDQVDKAKSFDSLLEPNTDSLSQAGPHLDEGYLIIPTAAVGGVPKGALLSQGNIMTCNAICMAEYGKANLEGFLGVLPLFHIAGIMGAWATFHVGGHTTLMAQFDAEKAVEQIDQHQLTYLGSFPPILERILDTAKTKQTALPSLKMVYGLEGPANMERLRQETSAEFWVGFGQAETTCFVTFAPASEQPGSAGRPSVFNTIQLVDDADQPVAPGEEGEIVVRGGNVCLEYWGMEDATQYAQRNGWHHTGDIGRLDEQGYLWYVKRKAEKELIKTGGENVYPGEVETVLLKHPQIAQCAVIGVPDPTWGESVKAICQLETGTSLTSEEVIQFVAEHIAGFKKPRLVEFVENLPEKEGEVDREKVKELYG